MNKEDRKNKFEKEHNNKFFEVTEVTKEKILEIIKLYPTMTNLELCTQLGYDEHQLSTIVVYLRKAGVVFPSKQKRGLQSRVVSIVEELKTQGLI